MNLILMGLCTSKISYKQLFNPYNGEELCKHNDNKQLNFNAIVPNKQYTNDELLDQFYQQIILIANLKDAFNKLLNNHNQSDTKIIQNLKTSIIDSIQQSIFSNYNNTQIKKLSNYTNPSIQKAHTDINTNIKNINIINSFNKNNITVLIKLFEEESIIEVLKLIKNHIQKYDQYNWCEEFLAIMQNPSNKTIPTIVISSLNHFKVVINLFYCISEALIKKQPTKIEIKFEFPKNLSTEEQLNYTSYIKTITEINEETLFNCGVILNNLY